MNQAYCQAQCKAGSCPCPYLHRLLRQWQADGSVSWQPEEALPRRLPSWAESPWSVRGQMFRLSQTLWEAGATPGAVIRTLGPWGPGLIQKYARSRCAGIQPSQIVSARTNLHAALILPTMLLRLA